jgi:hypothetical protein
MPGRTNLGKHEAPWSQRQGASSTPIDGLVLGPGHSAAIYPPRSPWWSETQIRSGGESVVLVYEAAEQVAAADIPRAHTHRDLVVRQRW